VASRASLQPAYRSAASVGFRVARRGPSWRSAFSLG